MDPRGTDHDSAQTQVGWPARATGLALAGTAIGISYSRAARHVARPPVGDRVRRCRRRWSGSARCRRAIRSRGCSRARRSSPTSISRRCASTSAPSAAARSIASRGRARATRFGGSRRSRVPSRPGLLETGDRAKPASPPRQGQSASCLRLHSYPWRCATRSSLVWAGRSCVTESGHVSCSGGPRTRRRWWSAAPATPTGIAASSRRS